jgi:hypothetical protein
MRPAGTPTNRSWRPRRFTSGDFGELFDTQLTGQIYAQPLISQPTVLAVTEDDNAYGLNSSTGAIEWQRNFGPQADPLAQNGCGDIGSSMGITGTPVIDPATGTAYFVAATSTGTGGATQYFMEAVNVHTGATPAGWPAGGVAIQGSADTDPGTVFDGQWESQRPGLILVNGGGLRRLQRAVRPRQLDGLAHWRLRILGQHHHQVGHRDRRRRAQRRRRRGRHLAIRFGPGR